MEILAVIISLVSLLGLLDFLIAVSIAVAIESSPRCLNSPGPESHTIYMVL